MIQLYGIMAVGYLVSTLNGFDSSLMGAINAMKSYQNTFDLTGEGSSTGIVFIIYNLGQIAAFPFCGFFADGYGRRVCIFVGCALVLVGTAIQASAHGKGQFIGGRFILGFGASIASAAGPAYTVELAHPAYRGTMAGMYNNFWWLGNILAGWTTYATNLHMAESSWAWRLPTIVQCVMPSIVMALIMFFPVRVSIHLTCEASTNHLPSRCRRHLDGFCRKTEGRRPLPLWPSTMARVIQTRPSCSSSFAKSPRTSR
jgi:MFS family permease